MKPEGSLPHSQVSATCPYPEPYQSSPLSPIPLLEDPFCSSRSKSQILYPFPLLRLYQRISPGSRLCAVFRNMVIFYVEELVAPRPTPKLEDHPFRLSATAYSMYSRLPSISGGRSSSIRNLRTRHAVVTGRHLSWPSVNTHTN
jgi:hypothetical protein